MVADPELRAETLVGYVDTTTIDQVVVDAFRNTTGLFTDAYLREVNGVCTRSRKAFAAIPNYETAQRDEPAARSPPWSPSDDRRWGLYAADFKAVKAPKKWRAFKSATVADNAASRRLRVEHAPPTSAPTRASAGAVGDRSVRDRRSSRSDKRYNKRMDAQHLLLCGSEALSPA